MRPPLDGQMGCDLFTCNRLPCQGKDGTVSGREMPCQIGSAPPGRGGLRTPASGVLPLPGNRPIRPPGVHLPPVIMICLGLRTALQCGRTECVPPRKPLSALSQGLPRKATRVAVGLLAEGRAPHARKDGITLTRISPPSDHLALANSSVTMPCPGLHQAFPRGRAKRIPPSREAPSPP